jgi:predicted porin
VGVRHTTNEGAAGNAGSSITRVIGGGMSQSRLGINVTEDLGDGMKALANLEHRVNADSGVQGLTQFWAQSWVGLQGGFGRVTMGRQYNVLFDLVTSTYSSYPYSPYFDAYKPEIGLSLGARADNMVKYMAEVGPLRGAVQVSAGEGSATGGKTMGGYLRYAEGGLAAGVGYQDYEFGSGKKVKATTFGASYRVSNWYLNAGYGVSATDMAVLGSLWTGTANGGFGGPAFLVANKRTLWTVGANYQLTPQINLGGHYFEAKQTGLSAAAEAKAKFLTLAADYAFSKRTDAYIEFDNTKLNGNISLNGSAGTANGAKKRDGYTIGLRHRF